MKNLIKTKWYTFGTYFLLVLAILLVGHILLQNNNTLKNVLTSFFEVAENRSFDYRQTLRIIHSQPTPSKDIVVLAIDDASLETLWEKFGEWPFPRKVYADLINHLEKSNPKAIVFDLMFIKSAKNSNIEDEYLVNTINKYNNIYTAINFDYQPKEVRKPVDLPERLNIELTNNSKIKIGKKYNYTNCRPILDGLLNGKVNIGVTNVIRNNDGIIRKIAPVVKYKDDFYPNLTFAAASKNLSNKDLKKLTINKSGKIQISNTTIPLTEDGDVILNWNGRTGSHTVYPLYRVINEMESKKPNIKSFDFKDKVIIIGTTAMSLHDTKSVPIQDSIYPGVEIHATFYNNMIDNNFITRTDNVTEFLIILGVFAIVGLIVMSSTSTIFALMSTLLFGIAYLFISYYVMELYNLWIPVVIPTISIIISFAVSFLAKYLIKSKDFEEQYKLATIDGLTELYNHRYFQDSLRSQIEISKRYQQAFSLIIIDIDYFKKFNDTYGHQAGDAVLKQVAQTLKRNSRATDIVCRYGGEEMSIILPNTSSSEAYNNAERICKAIGEKSFQFTSNSSGNVTISVGVSTYPDNAENAQDLIEYADKGLYYAKEHGRNQVGKVE